MLSISRIFDILSNLITSINNSKWMDSYNYAIELENRIDELAFLSNRQNGLSYDFQILYKYILFYPQNRYKQQICKQILSKIMSKSSLYGFGIVDEIKNDDIPDMVYNTFRLVDRIISEFISKKENRTLGSTSEEVNELMNVKMLLERMENALGMYKTNNPEIKTIAETLARSVERLKTEVDRIGVGEKIDIVFNLKSEIANLVSAFRNAVRSTNDLTIIKLSLESKKIRLPPVQGIQQQVIPSRISKPGSFDWIDEEWKEILRHPHVFLILGSRGEGKSCLGHTLLEYYASEYNLNAFLFSPLPKEDIVHRLSAVPPWITVVDSVNEIMNITDSVILFDEAHLAFHSRRGMKSDIVQLDRMIELSRQKDQTHIFVTQRSAKIDKNIIMSDATLLIKKPSRIQLAYERKELRELLILAYEHFENLETTLENPEETRKSFVFVISEIFKDDVGKMKQHGMASYWSEDLSKLFR
jgi:archaellum component FlaC